MTEVRFDRQPVSDSGSTGQIGPTLRVPNNEDRLCSGQVAGAADSDQQALLRHFAPSSPRLPLVDSRQPVLGVGGGRIAIPSQDPALTPVVFSCEALLPFDPALIAERILNVAKWPDFHGCWPIPGIAAAEFEFQPPGVVGARIRVTNRDGSRHVEEITVWEPEHRLQLRMSEFSPPLSRLATHFLETWAFDRQPAGTRVVRAFELYARSRVTKPALWVIAPLLRRAIRQHLREIERLRGHDG